MPHPLETPMTTLVVTLIGPDRPGIVNAVSDKAIAHGANWTDSLMANFAGQFAGIVQLDVAPAQCDALVADLRSLQAPDLQITVTTTPARQAGRRRAPHQAGSARARPARHHPVDLQRSWHATAWASTSSTRT
jgi:glycine cleavage system regulatory protein